jgi:bifunctional non-homologous end joining protein LigD
MQVEDHPREYGGFGGVISESEYGGGTVMVWDKGEWSPGVEDVTAALAKGDLKFTPYGKKLRGSWVLVRTRGFGSKADKSWLLIEHRDPYACKKDITAEQPGSVVSKRLFADIASDESGDVAKAATGDAQPKRQSRPRTTSPNRKKRGQS